MVGNHIRFAVIGFVVLFLALAGTASAAVAPRDSVVSSSIKDGEVKNPDIGTAAVTGPKVANDTLTGTKIKESALDFTVLQKRIAGLCPIGKAIRLIRQDGSVVCQKAPQGTVKSVATGTGLSGGPITTSGTIQLAASFRLPQACSNGQIASWNGSGWVCANAGGAVTSWALTGNAGTTSSNFLGTTDSQPFNLRVNDARALRLEPASDGTNQSPNVIGGISDNSVTAGAYAATIAGGGRRIPSDSSTANRITDSLGTVGGGGNNQAGDGAGTVDDHPFAVVGGGSSNTASGSAATVSGGDTNTAGALATVGGGDHNDASGNRATVAGGSLNQASGFAATVPGGQFNTAQGLYSLAAGGGAQANHDGAFVWADSSPFNFASTAQDQFNVRSTGGARLVSGIDGSGNPTSGLELPAGGSGWSTLVNGEPFDIRVNGARGLRIEPASDGTNQSPNVIGGISDNVVTSGVHSATIGGGGRGDAADAATANRVTDDQGTVGGGADNQAGDSAGTVSDRPGATVGGGRGNAASGEHATVGGGIFNTANGSRTTVAGGQFNGAGGNSATVAGGSNNSASGDRGAVGGGNANLAGGQGSTVAGGDGNHATGDWATVPGGNQNTAQGNLSLAAGLGAQANDNGAFVWADSNPFFFPSTAPNQFNVRSTGGVRLVSGITAAGSPTSGLTLPANTSGWSTLVNGQPFDIKVNGARALRIDPASDGTNQSPNLIGGGADNSVTSGAFAATIGGGGRSSPSSSFSNNRVTDSYGTVGGGGGNQAGDGAGTVNDRQFATVAGGSGSIASGHYATVGGGASGIASGAFATIPGGQANSAIGDWSFAAGRVAGASHNGAFVWADSSSASGFESSAPDQFRVRSTGGAQFVTATDLIGNPTAGVQLAPGGGSWSSLSDRNSKRAIEPASGRKILRKLASIPVSTWSYRTQDRSIRHIGPMAQDFYRAFGVGEDRRHIASVDADGVALAAIKGLTRELRAERRRRHQQARRMDLLEARVAALEGDDR